MEFLDLKKDDVVVYTGIKPYKLANGQMVKGVQELVIRSDVRVQGKFFTTKKVESTNKIDDNKNKQKDENKEKTLDEMNKEELIAFADKNGIDVDNRKGEKNLRKEIKEKLNMN